MIRFTTSDRLIVITSLLTDLPYNVDESLERDLVVGQRVVLHKLRHERLAVRTVPFEQYNTPVILACADLALPTRLVYSILVPVGREGVVRGGGNQGGEKVVGEGGGYRHM